MPPSIPLSNGGMSSSQSGQGDIRKALIDADLIECMLAISGQFRSRTQPIEGMVA